MVGKVRLLVKKGFGVRVDGVVVGERVEKVVLFVGMVVE